MKRLLSEVTFLILAAVFVVATFISAASAEKMSITGTNKSERIVSQDTMSPNDTTAHVMTQTVTISTTTSSNQEWNNTTMTDFLQMDLAGGTGTHQGYGYHTHKGGDQTFWKVWGTQQATAENTMTMEGKFQWTGGTGKFKNIKGGGTYTCTGGGASSHTSCDWKGEVEY